MRPVLLDGSFSGLRTIRITIIVTSTCHHHVSFININVTINVIIKVTVNVTITITIAFITFMGQAMWGPTTSNSSACVF